MVSSTSDSGRQEVLDKPEKVGLDVRVPEFSLGCLANHFLSPQFCFFHL